MFMTQKRPGTAPGDVICKTQRYVPRSLCTCVCFLCEDRCDGRDVMMTKGHFHDQFLLLLWCCSRFHYYIISTVGN